jgi:hypothetical protein
MEKATALGIVRQANYWTEREDKKSMVERDRLRPDLPRRLQFLMVKSDARSERPEEPIMWPRKGRRQGYPKKEHNSRASRERREGGVEISSGHSFSP